MGCATLILGLVAAIWSLKEFSNEGATTKAIALAAFAVALFALCAVAEYFESKYPDRDDG